MDTPAVAPLYAITVLPERRRKGYPVIAWVLIVATVLVEIILTQVLSRSRSQPDEEMNLVLLKIQSRLAVGMANQPWTAGMGGAYSQLKTLDTGPVAQRERFIVLAGELAGADEALRHVKDLKRRMEAQGIQPSADQEAVNDILGRLYSDYAAGRLDAPSVSLSEREFLRQNLGWFGDLALAPRNGPDSQGRDAILHPAISIATVYLLAIVTAGVVGLLGFIGLTVFLICLFVGLLQRGVQTGSGHGALYAESFALYLILFLLLAIGSRFLPLQLPPLFLSGAAALLSLSALFWPVLRGLSWRQVREDVGLTWGRQPALEPFLGLGAYAMALPMMAAGLFLTFLMLRLQNHWLNPHPESNFAPVEQPSHPIVKVLAGSDWWTQAQVFVLACVIAPLVEETMFRGVLYRHLREATARFGFALSLLTSTLGVSFIFAVIHPQGFLAIPGLMALATAFTLVREWRGSLLPGMIAHGVNNGLLLFGFIFLVS
jgi:membrane protease YdiL (CAAX protease family)